VRVIEIGSAAIPLSSEKDPDLPHLAPAEWTKLRGALGVLDKYHGSTDEKTKHALARLTEEEFSATPQMAARSLYGRSLPAGRDPIRL
jgi:hypothetical protein